MFFCHTIKTKHPCNNLKTLNNMNISGTWAKIICALIPFGSTSQHFFSFFSALSLSITHPLSSQFFNCRIIHLQALIYPPLSALYVQPSCEGIQLNAKWGCLRIKSLFQGESTYLWTRLLVFPSTLTLWARASVCHLFHSGPGNVLELEVPLFPLVWCLRRSSCGDNAR